MVAKCARFRNFQGTEAAWPEMHCHYYMYVRVKPIPYYNNYYSACLNL